MPHLRCASQQSPALKAAFRLIKCRLRSEKELRDRLKIKNFSEQAISKTVRYLKTISLVNDEQFARDWAYWKKNKNLSIDRIRLELEIKGISKKIIENTLKLFQPDLNEEMMINQLIAKKKHSYQNLPANIRKRRLYGYLARKGFASDAILTVLDP